MFGHRTAVNQGILESVNVQRAIDYKVSFRSRTVPDRKFVTSRNKKVLQDLLERVQNGWKPDAAVPWYVTTHFGIRN